MDEVLEQVATLDRADAGQRTDADDDLRIALLVEEFRKAIRRKTGRED
jgi:hypothetical protein